MDSRSPHKPFGLPKSLNIYDKTTSSSITCSLRCLMYLGWFWHPCLSCCFLDFPKHRMSWLLKDLPCGLLCFGGSRTAKIIQTTIRKRHQEQIRYLSRFFVDLWPFWYSKTLRILIGNPSKIHDENQTSQKVPRTSPKLKGPPWRSQAHPKTRAHGACLNILEVFGRPRCA